MPIRRQVPDGSKAIDPLAESLQAAAGELAAILRRRRLRIVLAESCTAGLVAAGLASVPGISEQLCGSFVTYRDRSKQQWLGLDVDTLERHTAVSAEVTSLMAQQALQKTEEAHIAVAVTGHLGPDAPASLDGKCFVAMNARTRLTNISCCASEFRLTLSDRVARQYEAAASVLRWTAQHLAGENR